VHVPLVLAPIGGGERRTGPSRSTFPSQVVGKVAGVDADRLLEGLDDAQLAAVTSPAQPLCILAGAGSGKTRVLTRRVAWRAATDDLDPRHVLVLTFTRKAASELTHRLRDLGLRDVVAAGTFHAVAYAQLRARWADRGIRPPALLDRKVGFVARLLSPTLARAATPIELVNEIEWAKARLVAPAGYADAASAAGRRLPVEPAAVADVYARYEKAKRERRMVDFDDLLRLCRRDLDEDREFGAVQRWRFRHLFVDEFQDVNPLQHELLEAWRNGRPDLCVVGDPNQAIYAWNGADASYLRSFRDRHPTADVVQLEANHRSSPQVLAVADAVLHGRRSAGDPGALRATRPAGPVPTVQSHADDQAEAAAVARAVRDHHRPGGRWADQAVLVRTHAQAALVETAFSRAGIPHRVRGASGLLDQPEVRQALDGLRSSSDLATGLTDLTDAATRADDDELAANLDALVRLGRDYVAVDASPTVAGYLAWLHASHGDQPNRWGDAVEIATFHAAKGLEWPVVHLAGLEQGLVPIGHARTPAALAEERRLLYVAITRAQVGLHCTWAHERTFGARTVRREPSPHLEDVRAACGQLAGGAEGPAPATARVPRPSRLPRPAPRHRPEHGVLSALQAWRFDVARAASVPDSVVFNDRTLEAIATARPRTLDELLAVPGIGEVKVSRYGDDVLRLVAASA
jgi:DNA helicase-2/ATP-dependent DNA helicase PcrA